MSGFVYLWFDRKKKRYYIGSHWGSPTDGYVCSSNWMYNTYKRRKEDFKRRIVSVITTSRIDLLMEEQRWLYMIPDHQLGKKYYNLRNHTAHWHADPEKRKTVGEKISASPLRNERIRQANLGKIVSEETREKLRQANLGKTYSPEVNKKKGINNRDYSDPVFLAKMSHAARNRSAETRKKISENNKRLHKEGRIGKNGPYRKKQLNIQQELNV
jgi:hypothetical protein